MLAIYRIVVRQGQIDMIGGRICRFVVDEGSFIQRRITNVCYREIKCCFTEMRLEQMFCLHVCGVDINCN